MDKTVRGHCRNNELDISTETSVCEEITNRNGLSSNASPLAHKKAKTGAELHSILTKSKKKHEESLLAYVTRMQVISIQGNIDEPSLIQYIINGLGEAPTNTIIL